MFSQVILPLLKSDLYEVIQSTFDGLLHTSLPVWLENRTALTVVMASKGYPGDYTKGVEITGKYPGTKGGIRVQQVTCVTAGLPPVLCSVPFTGIRPSETLKVFLTMLDVGFKYPELLYLKNCHQFLFLTRRPK